MLEIANNNQIILFRYFRRLNLGGLQTLEGLKVFGFVALIFLAVRGLNVGSKPALAMPGLTSRMIDNRIKYLSLSPFFSLVEQLS